MQRSQGAMHLVDRRRVTLMATGFAIVIGCGLGAVLLLTQPALSSSVRGMMEQRMSSGSAGWAVPISLAGLATGIASIGVFLLAGIVRGARRYPFLLLAPLLCALSAAALGALPLELSLGALGTVEFSFAALSLSLGGAALFQLRGAVAKIAGSLIWLLPAVLLLGGAASYQESWSPRALMSPAEHPLTALLLFSWFVLGVMACVSPAGSGVRSRSSRRGNVPFPRLRLAEPERPRAAGAERPRRDSASVHKTVESLQMQLADAERRSLRATELQESLRATQAKLARLEASAILGRSRWGVFVRLLLVVACAAAVTASAGYWLRVRPLQEKLAVSGRSSDLREQLQSQRAESAAAIDALQKDLEQARKTINEQAQADKDKAEPGRKRRKRAAGRERQREEDGQAAAQEARRSARAPAKADRDPGARPGMGAAQDEGAEAPPRSRPGRSRPDRAPEALGGKVSDDPLEGL